MAANPGSPYVKCEMTITFLIRKGVILPHGELLPSGHAAVSKVVDDAIRMVLPDGLSCTGSKMTIEDF